jgi:hypothetical protein
MGPSRFTSHRRGRCAVDFLSPLKKSIALGGFEPANFESSGKHTNHYTTEATKEISFIYMFTLWILLCNIFVDKLFVLSFYKHVFLFVVM